MAIRLTTSRLAGRIPDPDPAEIGRLVKRLRRARGWRLADLAAATGLHFGTVVAIERGQRTPNLRSLIRICVSLRRSMEHVVFGLARRADLAYLAKIYQRIQEHERSNG